MNRPKPRPCLFRADCTACRVASQTRSEDVSTSSASVDATTRRKFATHATSNTNSVRELLPSLRPASSEVPSAVLSDSSSELGRSTPSTEKKRSRLLRLDCPGNLEAPVLLRLKWLNSTVPAPSSASNVGSKLCAAWRMSSLVLSGTVSASSSALCALLSQISQASRPAKCGHREESCDHTNGSCGASRRFSVIATEKSRLITVCHHPAGTKIVSPGPWMYSFMPSDTARPVRLSLEYTSCHQCSGGESELRETRSVSTPISSRVAAWVVGVGVFMAVPR